MHSPSVFELEAPLGTFERIRNVLGKRGISSEIANHSASPRQTGQIRVNATSSQQLEVARTIICQILPQASLAPDKA